MILLVVPMSLGLWAIGLGIGFGNVRLLLGGFVAVLFFWWLGAVATRQPEPDEAELIREQDVRVVETLGYARERRHANGDRP